jgi:hypothetical protein
MRQCILQAHSGRTIYTSTQLSQEGPASMLSRLQQYGTLQGLIGVGVAQVLLTRIINGNPVLETDNRPSIFWISNPNNTWIGNVGKKANLFLHNSSAKMCILELSLCPAANVYLGIMCLGPILVAPSPPRNHYLMNVLSFVMPCAFKIYVAKALPDVC